VEEVALHIVGYDKLPTTLLSGARPQHDRQPMLSFKDRLRQAMTGFGFQEMVSYSLTSIDMLEKALNTSPLAVAPVHMANAMSAEHEYLRTSLRGNILAALESNLRHEEGAIRLFELGRVYLPRENDLPREPEILCGLMSDEKERLWPQQPQPFDFYSAKGAVESLLAQLDIEAAYEPSDDPGLCPGKQAAVIVNGEKTGVIGMINRQVAASFEIPPDVYIFELNLMQLLPHTTDGKAYQQIARFPAVVRDIALVVDESISHRQLLETIRDFPLVVRVALFDVYHGKQVPAGKKSLAYRLSFQSPQHTLTDKEVDKIQQKILARLSGKFGATLRAED
jgi:phenylalanyl-tRNA synthetase beta chain